MREDSLRTDSMSMVVSELSRELVASPSKEVDTDAGIEPAIFFLGRC